MFPLIYSAFIHNQSVMHVGIGCVVSGWQCLDVMKWPILFKLQQGQVIVDRSVQYMMTSHTGEQDYTAMCRMCTQ